MPITRKKTRYCFFALVAVVGVAGCVPPDRVEKSPNGKFEVRSRRGSARVLDTQKHPTQLWSIKGLVAGKCMVSDDGEYVANLWESYGGKPTGKEIALRLWHREKGELRAYRLEQLCQDFQAVGDRAFLRGPLPWFNFDRMDGDTLILTTIDNYQIRFALQTGDILSRERVPSFTEICAVVVGAFVIFLALAIGCVFILRVVLAR